MIKIFDCFSQLGMFDTFFGNITFFENQMIIPVFNLQIESLKINTSSDKIQYLKLSYLVFQNVQFSQREVHIQQKHNLLVIPQVLFRSSKNYNFRYYELEGLDWLGKQQYWNWIVESERFVLQIPKKYFIQNESFQTFKFSNDTYSFLGGDLSQTEYKENFSIIQNFSSQLTIKISALRDLSTHRPLLVREKIELDFLQKIQAADSLEVLQSIENEVNSTPTDPELIKQLLRNINEKKAFY